MVQYRKQFSTVMYRTVQYNTIQYSNVWYRKIQYKRLIKQALIESSRLSHSQSSVRFSFCFLVLGFRQFVRVQIVETRSEPQTSSGLLHWGTLLLGTFPLCSLHCIVNLLLQPSLQPPPC